jgi:hypothetical protein
MGAWKCSKIPENICVKSHTHLNFGCKHHPPPPPPPVWFYSPYGPWPLCQFLNLYTVGMTPWTGEQPAARPLPITNTEEHRHPWLEWDSNPRRTKTVLALDRAAIVIGILTGILILTFKIHLRISTIQMHWKTNICAQPKNEKQHWQLILFCMKSIKWPQAERGHCFPCACFVFEFITRISIKFGIERCSLKPVEGTVLLLLLYYIART